MNEQELLRRSAYEALKFNTRFASLATEIELQFRVKESPLTFLMASAHSAAVDALIKLATADAQNIDNVRLLQGEIRRYLEIASWLKNAVVNGREQLGKMDEDTREDWEVMMTENLGP